MSGHKAQMLAKHEHDNEQDKQTGQQQKGLLPSYSPCPTACVL